MGRLLKIVAMSAALVLTPALAGCGGSSSTSRSSSTATAASASQTTPAATGTQTSADAPAGTPDDAQASKTEHFPQVTLRVSSPAFAPGSKIPVRYTCDGAGTSPPLHWGAIPKGTAELALFILGNDGESAGNPRIYWAVAGMRPTLKGVSAGKLPPGAIVGRNSLGQSGYTICPTRGRGLRHYAVALLTLPRPTAATPGFDANTLYKAVRHTAAYAGLTGFTYKRR
jgi:phosphatidylethanolamine-binding protein (PEBP) family uncharacterized protein